VSRGYIGGGVINLAGIGNAFVKAFQGGNPVQQPVVRGSRPDKYADKVPGPLHFEDATFELPLNLPQALWDWVNASTSGREVSPKRFILSEFDYANKQVSHLIFEDCTFHALELPSCDSSLRVPGYLKLTLAPSRVIDAAVNATAKPASDAKLKIWRSSGFRLSIDGIDATSVTKIDAIKVRRLAKTSTEFSNLVVTVADVDLDEWRQWATQGFEGKPAERNGKLEYLATNRVETVLCANLEGLGVVRLEREKYDPSFDAVRRTKVELYVEKMSFSVSAPAETTGQKPAPPPPSKP
jgi:hypothetical protein